MAVGLVGTVIGASRLGATRRIPVAAASMLKAASRHAHTQGHDSCIEAFLKANPQLSGGIDRSRLLCERTVVPLIQHASKHPGLLNIHDSYKSRPEAVAVVLSIADIRTAPLPSSHILEHLLPRSEAEARPLDVLSVGAGLFHHEDNGKPHLIFPFSDRLLYGAGKHPVNLVSIDASDTVTQLFNQHYMPVMEATWDLLAVPMNACDITFPDRSVDACDASGFLHIARLMYSEEQSRNPDLMSVDDRMKKLLGDMIETLRKGGYFYIDLSTTFNFFMNIEDTGKPEVVGNYLHWMNESRRLITDIARNRGVRVSVGTVAPKSLGPTHFAVQRTSD